MRQDVKRTEQNRKLKESYRKLIKAAKIEKKAEIVSRAFSSIDKAAKQNIIHKNKAAHLKSSIAKVVASASKPVASAKSV